MKKSKPRGSATSDVEILNVSRRGLWLLVLDHEYFLPFKEYPWFAKATLDELFDVELLHGMHLRWPKLDVDLELEGLKAPERYPLVYR